MKHCLLYNHCLNLCFSMEKHWSPKSVWRAGLFMNEKGLSWPDVCVSTVRHVHSCDTLSHLLPLDKTSYSTMSNPEVNVILLTSKLNWGCGRLTLFLSSTGTSRPTLLKELCIGRPGGPHTCVRRGGVRGTGEDRDCMFLKKLYAIKSLGRGIVCRVQCLRLLTGCKNKTYNAWGN